MSLNLAKTLAIGFLALAGAGLSGLDAALALDGINANNIVIKGLSKVSVQTDQTNNLPAQTQSTGLSDTTSTIMFMNGGQTIAWLPLSTPSCTTDTGFTSVSVLYTGKGSKSGKFACKPTQYGDTSYNARSSISGTYSGRSSFSGGVLSLDGQLTWKEAAIIGGSSVGTRNDTVVIRQSLKVRLSQGTCEVISYSESGTKRSRGKAALQNGVPVITSQDIDLQSNPTGGLSCQIL